MSKVRIGLETHVQLNTKSKMFCACPTKGDKPNTSVCDVCLGFPGTKPMLNKEAVRQAVSTGIALNCNIEKQCFFSRKTYFYPDMSKNYQITQYDLPIATLGYLIIEVNDKPKKIRIRRVHLEEDPAKLVHVGGDITSSQYSLIDYNRSGIPLIEIVTEPDLSSADEARLYLTKLLSILEHLGVYDIYTSTLKTDANISITGGDRVEVKNITGFKAVEKALRYEIIRHENLLKRGQAVKRETRHFSMKTGLTVSLRTKETEEDYGYIFDPDLAWISMSAAQVKKVKDSLPELPDQRIARFVKQYRMNKEQAESLVITDKALADFYEEIIKEFKQPKVVAAWMSTDLMKCLNYNGITLRESKVSIKGFLELMRLIDESVITARMGKELIKEYVTTGISPLSIVKKKGLKLIDGELELSKVVKEVISKNKKAMSDFKKGNEKAVNYLVGQVMKLTKGQAEPKKVRELLEKEV